MKKADAILMSDLHIRPNIPLCRTDDYQNAQWSKIDFILSLSKQHDCPIIIAGDLGDKSQWPDWLLEKTINKFKGHHIIVIPGQHDLPNHRLDLWRESGIGVLASAEAIDLIGIENHFSPKSTINQYQFYLIPFPYGQPIKSLKCKTKNKTPITSTIAVSHQMVIKNNLEWPGQRADGASALLQKFPEYNLILTGDNHKTFTAEYKGRILVNPGSMMRMEVGQERHKPCVFLWFAKENTIKQIFLPIEQGVINDEHIVNVKERDGRMAAFTDRLPTKGEKSNELSFEKNMEEFLRITVIRKRTKEKIWQAIGE